MPPGIDSNSVLVMALVISIRTKYTITPIIIVRSVSPLEKPLRVKTKSRRYITTPITEADINGKINVFLISCLYFKMREIDMMFIMQINKEKKLLEIATA